MLLILPRCLIKLRRHHQRRTGSRHGRPLGPLVAWAGCRCFRSNRNRLAARGAACPTSWICTGGAP